MHASKMKYMLIDPGRLMVSQIHDLSQKDLGLSEEQVQVITNNLAMALIKCACPDDKPASHEEFFSQINNYFDEVFHD